MLWSADTAAGVISLLDPKDGRILETVRVASPTEVHGMTIHAGVLWFADAETCNIGTLSI
jgi:streptogramin lyase